MEAEIHERLAEDGLSSNEKRAADLRYLGQGYELKVGLGNKI